MHGAVGGGDAGGLCPCFRCGTSRCKSMLSLLLTRRLNCGTFGHNCAAQAASRPYCVKSVCSSCPKEGQTECPDSPTQTRRCVDLQTDPNNVSCRAAFAGRAVCPKPANQAAKHGRLAPVAMQCGACESKCPTRLKFKSYTIYDDEGKVVPISLYNVTLPIETGARGV